MSSYRINVRFDLNDETERKAAEYLRTLSKSNAQSRNRFIVEAVTDRLKGEDVPPIEQIRQMFREELQGLSVAAPAETIPAADTAMTAEQEAQNAVGVLADLELFG